MMINDINPQVLLNSFAEFSASADPLLHIHNEQDYQKALAMTEFLFEKASDHGDDPANDLITLVAGSIGRYEAKQQDILAYQRKLDALDGEAATLRLLMNNHHLTPSDLEEEIGKKALVSMILNGKRNLTKDHISKLSVRFNVSPALFF
ncbi:MAG: helix-turn-helix domain-containing protein [Mariprofundus sp.]|nr:helix-turn-helix domain-containing protein [Mariprofundus sp.]